MLGVACYRLTDKHTGPEPPTQRQVEGCVGSAPGCGGSIMNLGLFPLCPGVTRPPLGQSLRVLGPQVTEFLMQFYFIAINQNFSARPLPLEN